MVVKYMTKTQMSTLGCRMSTLPVVIEVQVPSKSHCRFLTERIMSKYSSLKKNFSENSEVGMTKRSCR